MDDNKNRHPLISAGTLLGLGLGGFVDGVLFHQLLQLHNMLSARFPVSGVDPRTLAVNLEINMFWDGLFHAFCWVMTAFGLGLLWRAIRRPGVPLSTRTLIGSLALGWGIFNLVEGVLDHHILHIHHVIEAPGHVVWDLAFLASGVLLVLLGVWLISSARGEVLPGRGAAARAM